MFLRTLLLVTACFALACSGSNSSVKKAKKFDLQPSTRCYEGSYRTYDERGAVRANTPLVTRYVVSKDRIALQEVELGGTPTDAAFEIDSGEAEIELDEMFLSGPITVGETETVIEVETKPGPKTTSSRLVLTDQFATEHVFIQSPEGSGHLVQVLVRIDDDVCDERMKLLEQSGRTTLSRRAKELLETAIANPGSGQVSLAFNWPKQLTARVWVDSSWNRNGEKSRSRTPFALTTEPHADGTLLQLESRFGETVTNVPQKVERVIQASDYLIYPSVIAPDGGIAAIHHFDEVAARVGAIFDAANPAPEGFLTREVMKAEVRKLWDPLVAAWSGADLKIGKPYNTRTRVPQALPIGGQAVVEATTEFVVWGYVPCRPSDEEAECVVIQLTQQTDPAYMRETMRRIFEEMGEEVPEMQQYEQLFSTITVADPTTLLPFEYHEVNSASFVLVPKEDEPVKSSKMDQKSMTFHYE